LSAATLAGLPATIERFGYDRDAQAVGIVHFGIGAFHRAHQAWYTDRAMDAGDRDWAIAGVSLRSPAVAEQMNPQDGLYSVAERSAQGAKTRVVGAVQRVLVAPREATSVIAALAAPATRVASLTITEKGYARAADGSLDPALAGEGSVYRFLAEGLRRRRDARLPGLTLLSCDNLAGNGAQLARLLGEYCDRSDPALGRWIAAECSFPATMVDRIVPATTPDDLDAVTAALGLRDEAAVITEPFSQWVIEDRFVAGRPAWEQVGAELVDDVAPYETTKLRMLNGAHSALAYLGLTRRHAFVHEAVADPAIRPLIERLLRREAAASLTPAPGQDLAAYADALLARFANPALNHRLAQIAMDGSQKLPQRWLETLAHHQRKGRQCPAILTALAAWLRHVRGDNGLVDDPLAGPLLAAWQQAGESGIVDALFGEHGPIASAWRPTKADKSFIAKKNRWSADGRQ
jgi:fructuronate reductase